MTRAKTRRLCGEAPGASTLFHTSAWKGVPQVTPLMGRAGKAGKAGLVQSVLSGSGGENLDSLSFSRPGLKTVLHGTVIRACFQQRHPVNFPVIFQKDATHALSESPNEKGSRARRTLGA
ncbi:hypothetical protein ROR02_27280 [Pararhodospirillum oryzae]|uniref:Uncharacterized protein n=1 Tax=Pararhodospirillum oryzae TaxID=478448 RepID=A0A512HAW1_9PROT|nr:hypothetical protein ROR02_27280 [Pararhodospirillum oryzae]